MDIVSKRNRVDLKKYFVKNAIPTETNFAELIEGTLNQRDDGIAKVPGDPLSLEAMGDPASQKKVLNLYGNFSDPQAEWVLSLNPRGDVTKPTTAKAGFSISDAAGTSRLFIDKATGNVGIGTLDTTHMLNVAGTALVCSTTNPVHFTSSYQNPQATNAKAAEISNDTGTYQTLMILGNTSAGVGRRVSIWDRLEVNGNLLVTGALDFGSAGRQMVKLSGTQYGIGIQASTTYFRTGNNFAWYKGGAHDAGELNAGTGGTVQMVIKDGKVGIGRNNPDERLHVEGDSIVTGGLSFGSTGNRQMLNLNSTTHGIGVQTDTTYFRTNKNFAWYKGGSHDAGELNTGTGGTAQMVIKDGNVGINKSDPGSYRLNVGGSTYIDGDMQASNGVIGHLVTAIHTLRCTGTTILKQEDWKTSILIAGWARYHSTWNAAQYFKDSQGIVHLRGMVKWTSTGSGHNQPLFWLPAGYRPEINELMVVMTDSGAGRCDITSIGEVKPVSGGLVWFSLDGITYRAHS